jgi:hypothetical protein
MSSESSSGQHFQLDGNRHARAANYCRQVAFGKAEHTVQLVVMFVEGAAGGDEAQSHIGL